MKRKLSSGYGRKTKKKEEKERNQYIRRGIFLVFPLLPLLHTSSHFFPFHFHACVMHTHSFFPLRIESQTCSLLLGRFKWKWLCRDRRFGGSIEGNGIIEQEKKNIANKKGKKEGEKTERDMHSPLSTFRQDMRFTGQSRRSISPSWGKKMTESWMRFLLQLYVEALG